MSPETIKTFGEVIGAIFIVVAVLVQIIAFCIALQNDTDDFSSGVFLIILTEILFGLGFFIVKLATV